MTSGSPATKGGRFGQEEGRRAPGRAVAQVRPVIRMAHQPQPDTEELLGPKTKQQPWACWVVTGPAVRPQMVCAGAPSATRPGLLVLGHQAHTAVGCSAPSPPGMCWGGGRALWPLVRYSAPRHGLWGLPVFGLFREADDGVLVHRLRE